MDEPRNITPSEKTSDTKGHIPYDSIYRKCSEEGTPQKGPADGWLPGAGGGMGSDGLMGLELLFEVLKMFWSYTDKVFVQH